MSLPHGSHCPESPRLPREKPLQKADVTFSKKHATQLCETPPASFPNAFVAIVAPNSPAIGNPSTVRQKPSPLLLSLLPKLLALSPESVWHQKILLVRPARYPCPAKFCVNHEPAPTHNLDSRYNRKIR